MCGVKVREREREGENFIFSFTAPSKLFYKHEEVIVVNGFLSARKTKLQCCGKLDGKHNSLHIILFLF